MAGGGTGGHLYPGLAVAEALAVRTVAAGMHLDLVWAATPRAVDQRLLTQFGDRYVRQTVQPLTKSLRKLWAFWRGWRQTVKYWEKEFATNHANCVVALGGYAAGPAAFVAAKRRIPVILLNPDALPGLANRFLLQHADVIVTQWPLEERFTRGLKKGGGEVKALGCPIRAELLKKDRARGAMRFNLDPAKRTLVITGASLGARTINDAFLRMLWSPKIRAAFEGRREGRGVGVGGESAWQILHLTGLDQEAAVREVYKHWPEMGVEKGGGVRVIGYCDDMASVWSVADLAIARAGASTCAELTACGVPSVLLPYPYHKDMHQRANAQELAKVGAAVIVEDKKRPEWNAVAIQKVLESLLYHDDRRLKMMDAARAAGKPKAADDIAAEILARVGASVR